MPQRSANCEHGFRFTRKTETTTRGAPIHMGQVAGL
jgi:hypothetical protein